MTINKTNFTLILGVVVALVGQVDENGEFVVSEVIAPGLAPQNTSDQGMYYHCRAIRGA